MKTGFQVAEVVMPPRPVDKYDTPSLLGNRPGKRFHVMVQPGSSICNLDCDCGFYPSNDTMPNVPGTGRMLDEVLVNHFETLVYWHLGLGS